MLAIIITDVRPEDEPALASKLRCPLSCYLFNICKVQCNSSSWATWQIELAMHRAMFKYYLILLNRRHTYYVGLHFGHKLLEWLFQRYQTPQMNLQRNNVQEICISFYKSSKAFEFLAFASDRQVCKSLFKEKGWKYFTFKGLLKWLLVVIGLFKVNLEFSFSFLDYFIPRSGFQT